MQGEVARVAPNRLPALDGLRGLLALDVTFVHALDHAGLRGIDASAAWAVWGFWVLSGMVLARGFTAGSSLTRFTARRIVRLWPVHLTCLGLAAALTGRHIGLVDLTLFPWMISNSPNAWVAVLANPPSWTLCIEAPVTLLVPMLALLSRYRLVGAMAGVIASLLLGLVLWPPLTLLTFFAAGSGLATLAKFRCSILEIRPITWIGKISYSLYLTHGPVLALGAALVGPYGGLLALPVALLASWGVWWAVERPSLWLAGQIRYRPLRDRDTPQTLKEVPGATIDGLPP